MTDWDAIKDALANMLSKATNIPFVWDDEPQPLLIKPYGLLSLGQSVTIGRDFSRYTFRDSDITLHIQGHREITITVQVLSRQSRGEYSSRSIIEKARLSLATSQQLYQGANYPRLIYVESHPIVDLNFSFDQRKESRSSFDVVFRLLLQDEQKANYMGYFDKVEIQGAHAR